MFSAHHPLASDCWHEQRHAHSSLCATQAVSVGGGLFSSHGAIVVQQNGSRISNPIDEDSYSITIKYSASRRYGDWMMREARLIRRLKPVFNKKLKGRAA